MMCADRSRRRVARVPAGGAAALLLMVAMVLAPQRGAAQTTQNPSPDDVAAERRACLAQGQLVCELAGTDGNDDVGGTIMFRTVFARRFPAGKRCGVRVSALVRGLTPGAHGFHVHMYGDTRMGDGTSTGGHFTHPDEAAAAATLHSFPFRSDRHWGDLGNLFANAEGAASYTRTDTILTLDSIRGRAIIIHADRDRGRTEQPTGASGARVAQCVIGYANPSI